MKTTSTVGHRALTVLAAVIVVSAGYVLAVIIGFNIQMRTTLTAINADAAIPAASAGSATDAQKIILLTVPAALHVLVA